MKMSKTDKWAWIAPVFLVVGILAIFLSLTYLPLSSWGFTFETGSLWTFMPWIVVIGIGLYVLKQLWRRN
jgi:hypothetical protein